MSQPTGSSGDGIGQAMAASVVTGLGLGYAAQYFFPSIKPWGLVSGLLLGAASGFWEMFKLNQRLSEEHEEERRQEKK